MTLSLKSQANSGMGQYQDKSTLVARWSLIAASITSLTCSSLVVALGLWTLSSACFLSGLVSDQLYLTSTYLQLGAGLVCLGNSALGCFSAHNELKPLLVLHSTLSLLLLSLLLMAGVLDLVFDHQVQHSMRAEMELRLRDFNQDPNTDNPRVSQAWDNTQSFLQCCGLLTEQVDQPWKSWKHNTHLNGPEDQDIPQVPPSCCRTNNCQIISGSLKVEANGANIWSDDCFLKGRDMLVWHSRMGAGGALAASASLVLDITFSIVLFMKLGQRT